MALNLTDSKHQKGCNSWQDATTLTLMTVIQWKDSTVFNLKLQSLFFQTNHRQVGNETITFGKQRKRT